MGGKSGEVGHSARLIVQVLALFVHRGTAQLVFQTNEKSAWGFTMKKEQEGR